MLYAKNDKSRYIYYFTIIPVITSTLAVGLFSYGSIISRLPILVSLSYVIILDINTWDLKEKRKNFSKYYLPAISFSYFESKLYICV